MRLRIQMLLMVIGMAAAVGLVACGGDDGDSGGDGFVAEATEICESIDAKEAELDAADADPVAQLEAYTQLFKDTGESLSDLTPETPEQETFVSVFNDLVQAAVPVFEDITAATKSGDVKAAARAGKKLEAIGQFDVGKLAQDAGLSDCNTGA